MCVWSVQGQGERREKKKTENPNLYMVILYDESYRVIDFS